MPRGATPVSFTTLAPMLLLALPPVVQDSAPGQTRGPLVTDRPDFTESVVTVSRGHLQLEGGYTFSREGDVRGHGLGELLLRVGILRWAELRLGLNSYALRKGGDGTRAGFENASLGAKFRLIQASPRFNPLRPGVALLVGTTIPTGSGIFGEDAARPEAKLALSWGITERVALGSNLNFALLRTEGETFRQFSGSVSLGLGLAERIGGYLEFFGFRHDSPKAPDLDFLNGGFTLLATDDLQFDVRAGFGFNDPGPDYFFGVGFAGRW